MGMTLFPSMVRLALQLMNKQKLDSKDSTYNSLECEMENKDQRKKVKTSYTIHAKNCLHRGMWNGQQYGRTLHMLMHPVIPSRNNKVKLPLT